MKKQNIITLGITFFKFSYGIHIMNDRVTLSHVYYEMRVYGKYLRVHAIDPDSGQEAMATGLLSMGETTLKNNAKRKLEYILTKKRREGRS